MISIVGITITFLGFLLFVGLIFLQIFLSKKPNRYYGLFLPAISFIISLILVFSIRDTGSLSKNITTAILTLSISNITTVVFILIYLACRAKYKKHSQVEKMKIKDLE